MRTVIAVTLSVVATLFFALTAAGNLSEQSFELTTVPASTSCQLVVTAVSSNSTMGLRAGDRIDAERLTAHEFGYFGLFAMVDALAGHTLAPAGRRTAQVGAHGALAVAAVILFSSTYGRVFTGCPPLVNVRIVLACYTLVIVLCLVLLWRGLTAPANGAERARLRWVFWSTVVGFSGPLISFAYISVGRPIPLAGVINLSFSPCRWVIRTPSCGTA